MTVGTDVDKLIISADTTDEGASKVVSGNENLQMGENRVTLKVTAQDGGNYQGICDRCYQTGRRSK